MDHLVSTNHSDLCKVDKNKMQQNFFEMIFSVYSNKNELYNLKIKKNYLIAGIHILQQNQNYQKKNLT